MAHDLLEGKEDFSDHYTAEDKQRFTAYIEQQLERISIPNKDVDFLRGKMLLMYANPFQLELLRFQEVARVVFIGNGKRSYIHFH